MLRFSWYSTAAATFFPNSCRDGPTAGARGRKVAPSHNRKARHAGAEPPTPPRPVIGESGGRSRFSLIFPISILLHFFLIAFSLSFQKARVQTRTQLGELARGVYRRHEKALTLQGSPDTPWRALPRQPHTNPHTLTPPHFRHHPSKKK